MLRYVVWVDDVLRQWCQYECPFRIVGNEAATVVHNAERIVIDESRRLIVIDPVADESDEGLVVVVPVHAGAVS